MERKRGRQGVREGGREVNRGGEGRGGEVEGRFTPMAKYN